ncbi:MAG: glutaredoxin domain-containing protein [Anaerolineales bacterium]|nr:glutaredoxin domain-containing protein [Anaerolineales bacterium]
MKPVILYGNPFCPQVYSIRRVLDRSGTEYEYFDIRQDEMAAARVREINHGNESVPTLVFPDSSTLTEPSTQELLQKLRGYGEDVEVPRNVAVIALLLEGPSLRLLAALFVLAGVATDLQSLTWIGLSLLALSFLLFFLPRRS